MYVLGSNRQKKGEMFGIGMFAKYALASRKVNNRSGQNVYFVNKDVVTRIH